MATNTTTTDAAQVIARLRAKVGTAGYQDECLRLAREAWGAPGLGGSAAISLSRIPANQLHSDANPPIGAPVWFTGGTHGAGHVATVSKYVNGVPYVITNDFPKKGVVGEVPLSQLESSWGNLHYAGWSNSINGKTILTGQTIPAGDGGTGVATVNGSSTATSSDNVFSYLAQNFGLTDAVLSLDKTDPKTGFTLKEAFDQIRTQKITDPNRAAEILASTNWFKANGAAVTQKLAQQRTAPGVFSRSVDQTYAQIHDRAAALGVQMGDKDLRALATQAYVYGLNDSQIVDRMLSSGGKYSGGGTVYSQLQQLDSIAYANGVNLSDADKHQWADQLIQGNKTPADYEALLREKSAQTYSVFADQIRNGQNLSDLTSSYRDKAASLLEVDPSMIKWDDPLFKDGKAFTTTDPKTGQPAVKNLWDFQKDVQADPRWQYTQNAHDTYMNTANAVLKRFGMVA